MTKELKPCPFCGGGAVKYRNKNGGISAGCISESCPAEKWSLPLKAWNTRTPATSAVELVRELRGCLKAADAVYDVRGNKVSEQTYSDNLEAIKKADAFLDSVGYNLSPTASAPEASLQEATNLNCPIIKLEAKPDEFTLLGVLADIRKKTGVGEKVMLGELADTLAALIQNGDSAIDTNKRLINKLQAKPELSGWQPIETAPKDGTRIWVNRAGNPSQAGRRVWWGRVGVARHGWKVAASKEMRYEPTHWQPLPAPPAAQKAGA